jgi:hypothetical protein
MLTTTFVGYLLRRQDGGEATRSMIPELWCISGSRQMSSGKLFAFMQPICHGIREVLDLVETRLNFGSDCTIRLPLTRPSNSKTLYPLAIS